MTSKKNLERAYDSLSNAITSFRSAKRPSDDQPYGDDLDALADVMRRRGAELIGLMNNASSRCGAELVAMCDRLTDQSAELLIAHDEAAIDAKIEELEDEILDGRLVCTADRPGGWCFSITTNGRTATLNIFNVEPGGKLRYHSESGQGRSYSGSTELDAIEREFRRIGLRAGALVPASRQF